MMKPFDFYLKRKLLRKAIPNVDMARSLIEKAEIRLERIKKEEVDEKIASMVFEDIYELLRESCQSLMEIKGYKPYSHEALIAFMKENNLLNFNEINILDNYRILRNNSIYKAEKVSFDKCGEALDFAIKTLPNIRKKFEMLTENKDFKNVEFVK